jgi:hypothetical protein
MRWLALVIVLLGTRANAQQPPCDLLPEQELPNCTFTTRSNYALHGLVHTVRVIKQDLAHDPRTSGDGGGKQPKLWVQEPGVWIVFSHEGEIIESAAALSADGTPLNPTRQQKTTQGDVTTTASKTKGMQDGITRNDKFDDKGQLLEQVAYRNGKLFSRHIQKHDGTGLLIEDLTFDPQGKLISHSSERFDARGRMIETVNIDNGQLVQHMRDTYDENSADGGLFLRGWYDEKGLFREISLRDVQATSWWQRPGCSKLCKDQSHAVGLIVPFHQTISYEFQEDGSLLTTVQHHEGRYGNIDNDAVDLLKEGGPALERISYRYVRDHNGNWTERVTSILDPATGQTIDVRLDKRELTYY